MTDARLLAEELGGWQERYDRLVQLAPDAILVHVSGVVVLANAAAVLLAGADGPGQLVGRLITNFLVPPFLKAAEASVLAGKASAGGEAVADRFRRLDGTTVDVEVTAIPFVSRLHQPAAHLVIRDLTERTQARDAERNATNRLRLLLSQLPALVWTADQSLQITSMQGVRDELLSTSLTADPALVATQQRALLGESATIQSLFGDRWLEAHVEPLYDANQVLVGCVGLVQDVTARKLGEAYQQQTERDAAVGTLAGGVAHEVNNMMAVVLGFSDLMLDSPLLPADHRPDVAEIRRAAERATAITSQLLAFSRRGAFQPVVIRVAAALTDAAPMLQRLLGGTRQLQLHLDDPPSARFDLGQFELVLVNLAINARDAMPAGGTFTITAGREQVDAVVTHSGEPVPPGSYAVVRIGDSGTGMPPAVLQHIFEPFFTTKPRGEGTGLGLAAVRGILDRNGIPFRVDSTPGRGTVFTLYMPEVPDAPDVPAGQDDAAPTEPSPPALDPGTATLLVVDDEPGVRAVVCRALMGHGYRVLEAEGGAAALVVLEHQGPPDAALIDLTMPDMDGPELALRIASLWPGVPILFMSGHTDHDVAHLLGRFPGAQLIRKPFDTTTLLDKVREAVARRGGALDDPETPDPPKSGTGF